jgi:galactose-1-phosphate uridylyltransferase
MASSDHLWPEPLRRMPDGTVKQINPYSGTSVWTVPGRGNRRSPGAARARTDRPRDGRAALRVLRGPLLDTPPEKSRLVADPDGWHLLRGADRRPDRGQSVAQFRRIPNLFEIVAYDYWRLNYGFEPGARPASGTIHYLDRPRAAQACRVDDPHAGHGGGHERGAVGGADDPDKAQR